MAILRQQCQIKIPQIDSAVVPVLASYRVGRHTKSCRTKHPIRIRKGVKETKVFKAPIGAIEAIPLRFFDTDAQASLRISSPACCRHEKRFEQIAFAVFRFQQKRTVEKSWTGL